MGTVNCAGYIGYPQYHYPMSNSTNMPYAGIKLTGDFAKGYWITPAGRYRQMMARPVRKIGVPKFQQQRHTL